MINAKHTLQERIARLLKTATGQSLRDDVRTSIPGHVLSYDPATQLAQLQIGIQRLNLNGDTFTPPPIIRCPVLIYGGAGGVVEVEIQPGDECLIHFSMRCIDGWRNQGGVAPLTRIERFREADAFAVLAPRSAPNVITDYSNDGIRVRSLDGQRYVWLKNDGTIDVRNESGEFTIDPAGTITAQNDEVSFTLDAGGAGVLQNGSGNVTLTPGGAVDANGATITTGGNVITANGTDLDAFKQQYDSHFHISASSGDPSGPPL